MIFLTCTPSLSDAVTKGTVAHACGIKDDRLEFGEVNLSVRQDALVGTLVHHFANQHAVLETDHFALQRKWIFVDDGSIDIGAGRDGETDLGHLITQGCGVVTSA